MANISELSVLLKANTKQASQQMQGFGQSMGSVFSKMKVGILAVSTAFTGFAIASVKDFIEIGDMLGKMASRTKISVEALDSLRIALDLSGTTIQGFEKGMRTLVMRVDDARKGNVEFIDTFQQLGISVNDFEGLKPEELFMRVAGGIAEVSSELQQQAIATDLLGGKFGNSLLPALENGAEGFRDLLKEADAMSNWTDEESQMAEDLADDITILEGQMDNLKRELASHLVPALITTVTAMNDYIDAVEDAESPMKKMITDFGILAFQLMPTQLVNKGMDKLTEKFKMMRIEAEAIKLAKIFGTQADALVPLIDETQRFKNMTGKMNEFKEHTVVLTDKEIEALKTLNEALRTNEGAIDNVHYIGQFLIEATEEQSQKMLEQASAVQSATESWIDYHMAIGGFQSPDAGGGGSIYDEFPSMMGTQGQSELFKGVLGLPSVGGDPAKAKQWLDSSKNPFNAGGFNAFNFPTNQGSSNVVLTNIAQINAGLKDAKMQGSE
jgi:TP901 family phage tail tape measure protein